MRRSFAAIHIVSLALWLGALVFTFFLAKTLFDAARPVCPYCLKVTAAGDTLSACTECGALHHARCAQLGCALEHGGTGHSIGAPGALAAPVTTTGLGRWERVKLRPRDDQPMPQERLLWRLDAPSGALLPEKGEVPGACFQIPRAGVGDALARAFQLAQALGVAMAISSFLTVLLTPPGGALRFLRVLAIGAALAATVASLWLGQAIATQRLELETVVAASSTVRGEFGKLHGMSSAVAVGEALLVLVALVLALGRRDPTPGAPPPSS